QDRGRRGPAAARERGATQARRRRQDGRRPGRSDAEAQYVHRDESESWQDARHRASDGRGGGRGERAREGRARGAVRETVAYTEINRGAKSAAPTVRR